MYGYILIMAITFSAIISISFIANRKMKDRLDKAQNANQAKTDFMKNMSPEIRTPLNGIMGLINVLLDSDLSSSQRKNIELIYRLSQSLEILVNDLLDISLMKESPLYLKNDYFDIRKMCDGLYLNWAERFSRKGIVLNFQLTQDIPDSIYGDLPRLRQVLANLLCMTYNFSEHGQVDVSISMQQMETNPDANEFRLSFSIG